MAESSFQSRVQAILEAQQKEKRPSPLNPLSSESKTPAPAPRKAKTEIEAPSGQQVVVPRTAQEPYSPEAMLALIISNPDLTHAQYAAHFGRTPSWFASVLASEAFQIALADRKDEIPDPAITATMEERLKALAMRSLFVIQSKLDAPQVSDQTVLAAAQLGIKGLGLGNAVPVLAAPPALATGAEAVADRIMEAMARAKARTNAQAVDVAVKEVPGGS